ncbi:hypothetical protein K431DRAFT_73340 [Polychaeton citri CBS 116435]|uniref:Uncharacterized protein n=1 Tax=Polychaeton citri CBS 116435 TaxID=1314669 RepID=A0A9P4QB05_9PEZI|nr:hypothetical protein K431DRAFT_73340 [Polychaeton citri CBS 116435]
MVTVFWENRNSDNPVSIGPSTSPMLRHLAAANMNSPLPDSSQLEAGIIEDSRPSRLSRVQDNVRDLLRNSAFGSVRGSPSASPSSHWARTPRIRNTPLHSPLRSPPAQPEVLPSPNESSMSDEDSACSSSTTSPFQSNQEVPGILFPPTTHQSYQQAVQHMAHQSALFNARAAAAINHPDLSDPSLTSLEKEKSEHHHRHAAARQGSRQHSAHRSRHQHNNSSISSNRHTLIRRNASSWILSVLSGLLLSALVATCRSAWSRWSGSSTVVGWWRSLFSRSRPHNNFSTTTYYTHPDISHPFCPWHPIGPDRVRPHGLAIMRL